MSNPFMQHALKLASDQLGQTWPNPAVGAVVVKDGRIIGEGATGKGGRPHAETIALSQAGEQAKGATLYVTLEPCSHHGKTPPCVDAIIAAGISECVIACTDINPEVGGKGTEKLRAAGITITENIACDEARASHEGFFSLIEKKRPFIALKIAISADDRIASAPGVRTAITGIEALEHAQQLRAEYDAILTGTGTVLADDPQLTVRIPGMEHRSPLRVVWGSRAIPESAKIHPAQIYTRDENVIAKLTKQGITRLLVEAGQGLNSYFLDSNLVDRLYVYRAPHTIGADGLKVTKNAFSLEGWQQKGDVLLLGNDTLTIFERA